MLLSRTVLETPETPNLEESSLKSYVLCFVWYIFCGFLWCHGVNLQQKSEFKISTVFLVIG